MNDENCHPEDKDVNLTKSSVKAGAAVFGNLVFGSEYPDHSLCYSPSPCISRKNENTPQEEMDGKILSFDNRNTSAKLGETKKEEEASKLGEKRGLRQRESNKKPIPHRKNKNRGLPETRVRYKQQNTVIYSKSDSASATINDVRRSKEEHLIKKVMSVSELREQRRLEREQMLAFNLEAEQTRRQVIELRKKLNARFSQSKVERERKLREKRSAMIENEINFKSQVHVEHKQSLKEQESLRRRMSINDRAKLRKNHQEGRERMKLASIQEDQALFEERQESSAAARKAKSDIAEKRRNSFAFRNGDARRIRELYAERETQRAQEEHQSFALKWNGERDTDDYKRQMAKERRESLAFRNAESKRIRDLEGQIKVNKHHTDHESYELKWEAERDTVDYKKQTEKERRDSLAFRNAEGKRIRDFWSQKKANDQHGEHESYELKWAGERDADGYKMEMSKERRDSLAFRNAEGKRTRDFEAQKKSHDNHDEHESYELKWAGERDADAYREQMNKDRRDSFSFRNAEGKCIRDLESQIKANDLHNEHESYELKWSGERDAENYKKQMDEERRDGFAFRNAEGKSIRDLESQIKATDQHNEHESYELKWAGERDADEYRKEMEKDKRESLQFCNKEAARHADVMKELVSIAREKDRESFLLKWEAEKDAQNYKKECSEKENALLRLKGKESFNIRLQAENDKRLQEEQNHESHLLDTKAWQDVNDYVKECKLRSRLSLAFRAKEKRCHFQIEKEQSELMIRSQHLDTHYRSVDARYIEMTKLKEKACIALEALSLSPTCSFGANSFSSLLD